jgi:hypothetical protein
VSNPGIVASNIRRRRPSRLLDMPVEHIAWVAGLLDGEGSFIVLRRKTRVSPALVVCCKMTDLDLIERLQEVTGVGTVSGPHKGTNKPSWTWACNRVNDGVDLCKAIYPWMGIRRQAAIRKILQEWSDGEEPLA